MTRSPDITLIVGDLSSSGAGRWSGAVRPFLLAKALKMLDLNVQIVGFSFGESANWELADEKPDVLLPAGPYPGFFKTVGSLLNQIDGTLLYAYKLKPTSFGVALLHKYWKRRSLMLDIDDWELSWHGGDEWHYRPTLHQLGRDLLKPNGALRHPDHPLYLQWAERLIDQANVVTTHTQFLKQRFSGIYIPNGKDLALFDPANYNPIEQKRKYGLSDYTVLMFPGAPRPYKGLEDVLMALDMLNQSHLRLVIVGGSPYDDYDSQLMQRWGRWIVKLPKMPYSQMPGVVAAADLIVVPQRNVAATQAQFPLKLTDGMAMAKPILATRVGDIPALLAETGYLADADSPAELGWMIQHILQHPEEAKIKGLQARERCQAHYSIESMAAKLSTVIAPLLSSAVAKERK